MAMEWPFLIVSLSLLPKNRRRLQDAEETEIMTSTDLNRGSQTAIAYGHESSSTSHQRQRKRQRKALADHLEKRTLEDAQSAGDEMERMWHRGYMMALKDVLMLFDDTRVPKT
jgi:predicted mannosyl-3-phosphoglycerate phosphatase (HAD superfamily)